MWGLLEIFTIGVSGKEEKGAGGCLMVVVLFVVVATIQGIMSLCSSAPAPVVEKRPGGGQQIVEKAGEQAGKSFRSFTRGLWKGMKSGGHED